MTYFIAITALFAIFAGNVAGCVVLCETVPELTHIKRFAWCIPILNFAYIIKLLLSKEDRGKKLIAYLSIPHKNIIGAYTIADVVHEKLVEQQRFQAFRPKKAKHVPRWSKQSIKDSVESYGQAVFGSMALFR